jgi:SSS family solute:Na+ symporter
LVTTLLTAGLWLLAMLATPPESPEVLERFVRQVRPPGPGWTHWRQRTAVQADETLPGLLLLLLAGCALLFGALLGIGGFLLKLQLWGWGGLVLAVVGGLLLRRGSGRVPAEG